MKSWKALPLIAFLILAGVCLHASTAMGALSAPVLSASAISSSQIALTWTDPNPNEAGVNVERALSAAGPFSQIAQTDKNTTSFTATGLAAGTTYYFRVRAFANGNGTSPYSNVASARTTGGSDTTPPTVSLTSPPSGTTYTSAQTVTINASASDNVGVSKVEFYLDGTRVSTDTTAPYSHAWAITSASNGAHSWRVTAFDAVGNSRDAGPITLNVNIGGGGGADTTPPSIPTGLNATTPACGQVSLSWTASTDNSGGSGVLGYAIYRDGIFFVGQALAPVTTFTESGLAASTTYSYTVSALDNAYNESARSVPRGVTTQSCNPSQPTGAHIWSRASGGSTAADSAIAYSVATDGSGNVYMTGTFEGTVNFGGGNLTGAFQTPDIFVAKYNAAGTHQWSARFGSNGSDAGTGIAVDSAGNVLLTGRIQGNVDFGGGAVASDPNSYNVFIVKLNSGGGHVWSKAFGSAGADEVSNAIAVDSSGNLAITGYFAGSANLGGGGLPNNGSYDAFVARYSSSGAHLWSKGLGGASSDLGLSVAMDGAGAVVVSGAFQGTVNFGGGALTSTGDRDIFVAKYSASAAHLWSKKFGNLLDDYGRSVVVDSSNNVILAGSFQSSVNFGGFALGEPLLTSVGLADIFVAKYNSAGGYVWSKRFGGSADDAALGLAVDTGGNVTMTGYFQGTANFGGANLTSAGSRDIFFANFSAAGSHQWSKRAGGTNNDNGNDVTTDLGGNVVGVGDFSDSANFGGSTLTSPGGTSAFTVKFGP